MRPRPFFHTRKKPIGRSLCQSVSKFIVDDRVTIFALRIKRTYGVLHGVGAEQKLRNRVSKRFTRLPITGAMHQTYDASILRSVDDDWAGALIAQQKPRSLEA